MNLNITSFLDIMAIFLSINIVLWFSVAIYFNVKRTIIFKQRKQKIIFLNIFNMIVNILFTMAFLYVIITTLLKGSIIDNSSYGAVVVRPLIVMEAVGTAINQREKYIREKNQYGNII